MRRYFEVTHVVTFADTNVAGNVYFASHLAWQGRCRELFLAEHAPGVLARLDGDLALVTVSCSCDYYAELHAFDTVSVRMSLRERRGGRITMDFDYYLTGRGAARLVARGRQTIACMTRTGGGLVPADPPDDLAQALDAYAPGAPVTP
ncbi:acyl-CoA thioesterase [Actinomadura miaoliensis]|uniref:Acyl-CoA thioesterase n=1 Tax=Actinomadura miaoliensis TaxID=430685 RepID=A0ABP7WBA0_9ACTN